ncbi:proline utilization trans-activator [Trichomonascus vanleenenianus]|uniref:Put3p n=1 Tax=Trichomonascus vanleenenianus TaxID=2268995 RepID=UPI003ECAC253
MQMMTSKKEKEKDKTNRITVACDRCRKRHIRCDGGEVCANCAKTNAKCVYVEADKKIIISLKYVHNLQDEIARLKARLGESDDTASSEGGSKRPLPQDDGTPEEERENTTKKIKSEPQLTIRTIVPNSSENRTMFEGNSSLSAFGLEIKDLLPTGPADAVDFNEIVSHQNPSLASLEVVRRGHQVSVHLTRSEGRELIVNFVLPEYHYALQCLNIFNSYLSGCFYFFNTGLYKYSLYQTYYDDQQKEYVVTDLFWFAKLLLVTGIGQMYLGHRSSTNTSPEEENYPGRYYFDRAGDVLNAAFQGRLQYHGYDIEAVEVILLYSYFHQMSYNTNGYYILSGLCMRCALVMGMHADRPSNDKNTVDPVAEHRRRLFWTIYNMDRYLSAKSGFPISIPDESISTPPPTEVTAKDTQGSKYSEFPPARYINSFIEVSRVSSSILLELYQPGAAKKDVLSIISSIMTRLFDWKKDLPEDLVMDTSVASSKVTRTACNIYSDYYQCINLAVRPLLLHFMRKRIEDKTHAAIDLSQWSENVLTLLNASLDASIQTIKSLHMLEAQNMFATFGYLDREYIFSAASTLVMFNVAFSLHRSTTPYIETVIQMFTRALESGNLRVAERLEQLRNFISSFDFIDGPHTASSEPEPQTPASGPPGPHVIHHLSKAAQHNANGPTAKAPHTPAGYYQELAQNPLSTQPVSIPSLPEMPPDSLIHPQPIVADNFINQGAPYAHYGADMNPGERDLWEEINSQGFWLSNISDEFMNMIES